MELRIDALNLIGTSENTLLKAFLARVAEADPGTPSCVAAMMQSRFVSSDGKAA